MLTPALGYLSVYRREKKKAQRDVSLHITTYKSLGSTGLDHASRRHSDVPAGNCQVRRSSGQDHSLRGQRKAKRVASVPDHVATATHWVTKPVGPREHRETLTLWTVSLSI